MKSILTLLSIIIGLNFSCVGQSASDVLAKSEKLNQNLYLKWDTAQKKITYKISRTPPPLTEYDIFEWDSSLFLPTNYTQHIYLFPLNPLNYSYSDTVFNIDDPIYKEAEDALIIIGTLIQKQGIPAAASGTQKANAKKETDEIFSQIVAKHNQIIKSLSANQKQKIVEAFLILKGLSFTDSITTNAGIQRANAIINNINDHFELQKEFVQNLEDLVAKYNVANEGQDFLNKIQLNTILEEVKKIQHVQISRFADLKNARDITQKAYEDARSLGWIGREQKLEIQKGKIVTYRLSIVVSGLEIKDSEIVAVKTSKTISTKVIRLRRFRTFVPEVFAGFAYTLINYPKYGTTADSSGQQHVADAGSNTNFIKRVAFNTMLNFNVYFPNSDIIPFAQLGVGANSEVPMILGGIGGRFHISKTLVAVSFGYTGYWVKDLDKLKVGSPVTGTADIEKDLKYTWSNTPKFYIGFQVKL